MLRKSVILEAVSAGGQMRRLCRVICVIDILAKPVYQAAGW